MRPIPRRLLAMASAVALTAGLLSFSTAPSAEAAGPSPTSKVEKRRSKAVKTPKLGWYKCYDYARCATVKVPLDYDKPKGKKVALAVLKVPARNQKKKIGTLFVNPGGPGGSGTELAYYSPYVFSSAVTDRFDVVGFDPRGIAFSKNVKCFPSPRKNDPVLDTIYSAAFPYGAKQEKAFIKAYGKHAKACSTTGKPLSGSMSTAEVARDMDLLRRAVGDKKLTYFGFSYGSYLGEVYANLYPNRVRALAIDGVLDPVAWAGTKKSASTPMGTRLRSAEGASKALRETLLRCDKAGPTKCSFSAGDPVANYEKIAQRLRKGPLYEVDPESGERYLAATYDGFVAITLSMLYDGYGGPDYVADYASYLHALIDPTTSAGMSAAQRRATVASLIKLEKATEERQQQRGIPGRAFGFPYDNSLDAFQSVVCTDSRNSRNIAEFPELAREADRKAPYFGRLWLWNQAGCASPKWKVKDEDAYRGPFTKRTSSPVLIVGNRWDPATNYAGAVSTSKRMPNSRLLSSSSWGHTAYGSSDCVTDAVDTYLLTKKVPAKGTRCVGDYQPFVEDLVEDDEESSASRARQQVRIPIAPTRPGLR
jgi:pimeloyl-ACP methyl ester carboxylesterase